MHPLIRRAGNRRAFLGVGRFPVTRMIEKINDNVFILRWGRTIDRGAYWVIGNGGVGSGGNSSRWVMSGQTRPQGFARGLAKEITDLSFKTSNSSVNCKTLLRS